MAVPTRLRAANFNKDFMGGFPARAEGSKGLYAISARLDAIGDVGASMLDQSTPWFACLWIQGQRVPFVPALQEGRVFQVAIFALNTSSMLPWINAISRGCSPQPAWASECVSSVV